MRPDRPVVHVGDRLDAAWAVLPADTIFLSPADRSDLGDDIATAVSTRASAPDGTHEDAAATATDPVVVVRVGTASGSALSHLDTDTSGVLRSIRARLPEARILVYSAEDDPDAAIDASRFDAEYVSGRRLIADDETLEARIADRATPTETGEPAFLESFVRIVSDRTTGLEAKLDALLDLGRARLDLSIGYASRTTEDRFTLDRHRGGSALVESLEDRGVIDSDGSLPLSKTYCRRTVGGYAGVDDADSDPGDAGGDPGNDARGAFGGDTVSEPAGTAGGTTDRVSGESGDASVVAGSGAHEVVAFTDPTEAGWDGDPAHELFGLGSYVGGRVVVDDGVYGTLCFVDEDSRERPFTEDELLFVELLADWLGRAIERRKDRERREEAVRELENTLSRIDDGFFALDTEWRFTYVNDRAAALLDRPADELIGSVVWDEFPAALGRAYETSYRRAMETQETVSFVDHYAPLDLWTEVTAYPSPEGLSVFFADVTEQRRREETLERLLRTAERMQRDPDPESVADRLNDAVDDILGFDIGGVRFFDPDTERLRLVSTGGDKGEAYADRDPRVPGDGVAGTAFETGETQTYDDLNARDDGREYHGIQSVIGVPLGDHGSFVVGSTEPDAFDDSDVSVVELLAMNATATLDAQRRQERLRTYENALQNVDDMVCVLDGSGDVTYATPSFISWLGVDEAELIGSPLCAVLPDPTADRVAGALDGLVARDAIDAEAHGGEDDDTVCDGTAGDDTAAADTAGDDSGTDATGRRRIDVTIGGAGGPERHGELRLSALSGGVSGAVVSLTDTTDLRRTRTALSRERDRFDRLFERLPDPVMEVSLESEETVVTGINSAFASQFGHDPSTLRGQSTDALDIDPDRHHGDGDRDGGTDAAAPADSGRVPAEAKSLDQRVREEGSVTAEVTRQTVDGPREFLFRGFSYETTDGRRAFGIYTDITDRKRRERYVRVINRILRHNLRNELNVVFGFASEIELTTDDDRIADFARRIETTGKRLSELAEGAATIKHVVENGSVTDPDSIPVRPAAEAVRDRYAEVYPGARISVSVPDDVEIRGDERFEDALDQLVENAVAHGSAGAPRIEISADRDPATGTVTVRVADDGSGIPEPVRAVITGDAEVTQLTHNTGIGLWIVAWIVESYGGEIAFGPGIGGAGTTVTLRIPAAE
ncbi:PAS domain-containing protein [Halorubrum sp. BV1]|uniref:PAS domain-containing protein n=1 Tax=Halorubrum sp. BV1 TaxID=1498500 RepID=UPI0006793A5D|nr:PAS domain-containing protein [Halorubrum sp. BV1]